MGKILWSYLLLLTSFLPGANAQLKESFDDGDFLNDPAWAGNTTDFIVNSALQLQSNNVIANSNFMLSTPNTLAQEVEWEMYVALQFNPSSANYVDVYLVSSESNFATPGNNGYFLRIGNTDDEISLYRLDGSGISTKIIDGTDGILNKSNNTLKIKVTRDANNMWEVFRDLTGAGNSFVSEGTVIDATYTISAFFGFLIKQSTTAFFQKHFFDDIEIKTFIPDTIPPSIISITTISSNSVDLLFDESLDKTSAELPTNYFADNSLANPLTAVMDATSAALVHITFATSFASDFSYTLLTSGVSDLQGNVMNDALKSFSYHAAQQFDVVVDELMVDPTPEVLLPDKEWIELKNNSLFNINLKGWKLGSTAGLSGPMPDYLLKPDSFLIICSSSSLPDLQAFGPALSVTSFPSLNDDVGLVSLYSAEGKTIHAVQYSAAWYQNDLKKNGGWSLEMIDTQNPCSGRDNWKSSTNTKGGTPGSINSNAGNNPDSKAPKLVRAYCTSDTTVILVFDEALDSLNGSAINHFTIDQGIVILNAEPVAPLFSKVNIKLSKPINIGTVYSINALGITDCVGNVSNVKTDTRFGLAQDAKSLDVVVNEILFNPKPNGVDYVELYNRSKKIIDLSQAYLANRNSANEISNIQKISAENILLFPGDYMALTSDPAAVKLQYLTKNPDAFISIKNMPTYPDDRGDVILLNKQGDIVDEVAYSDGWHFPLISNTEGVSLERIDYDGASVNSNFHSAATSAGFGTPGYKNSQYRMDEILQEAITVTPEIFSPDNDGIDDFTSINYNFPSPGYVANITIFDGTGRPVRYLQRNALSGTNGYFRWDGLDDKNRRLPQGIYIVYTEIFNTDGKKKQFKNTIVLARKY